MVNKVPWLCLVDDSYTGPVSDLDFSCKGLMNLFTKYLLLYGFCFLLTGSSRVLYTPHIHIGISTSAKL